MNKKQCLYFFLYHNYVSLVFFIVKENMKIQMTTNKMQFLR